MNGSAEHAVGSVTWNVQKLDIKHHRRSRWYSGPAKRGLLKPALWLRNRAVSACRAAPDGCWRDSLFGTRGGVWAWGWRVSNQTKQTKEGETGLDPWAAIQN